MYALFKHDLYQQALAYKTDLQQYLAGHMPPETLHRRRLAALQSVLQYSRQGSEFYAKRLHDIDLQCPDLDKLIQSLPFTTKTDLREAGNQLCSARLEQAWVYYETTGTTGPATPCPRNEIDSLVNNTFLTLQYQPIFQNSPQQHIIGIMGPTELHSTGDTFEDVFRSLNQTVIKMWPRSPVVGMARVLKLIQTLKITALVCTPAVASELLKYCESQGVEAQSLGLQIVFVLGELIAPHRLRNLGHAWGAQIYNCMYASQEASILAACNEHNQLQTIPFNNYYELLDPVDHSPIEVTTSPQAGELVITHLYQGHKPLIRYQTGDLVRARLLNNQQWAIEPIGRVRDIIHLQERSVYAHDLENLIFEPLQQCYEYCVEIVQQQGQDQLAITLQPCDELTDPHTVQTVRQHVWQALDVPVQVQVAPVDGLIGTAAMVSWKAARIHDLRQQQPCTERSIAQAIASQRKQSVC